MLEVLAKLIVNEFDNRKFSITHSLISRGDYTFRQLSRTIGDCDVAFGSSLNISGMQQACKIVLEHPTNITTI